VQTPSLEMRLMSECARAATEPTRRVLSQMRHVRARVCTVWIYAVVHSVECVGCPVALRGRVAVACAHHAVGWSCTEMLPGLKLFNNLPSWQLGVAGPQVVHPLCWCVDQMLCSGAQHQHSVCGQCCVSVEFMQGRVCAIPCIVVNNTVYAFLHQCLLPGAVGGRYML
jgi:hypothetical protein